MRKTKQSRLLLTTAALTLTFVMVLASVLTLGTAVPQGSNVAEAAVTTVTPPDPGDDTVQTVAYDGSVTDWVDGVTYNYTSGTLWNRVITNANGIDANTRGPDNEGEDNGTLFTNNGTTGVNAWVSWEMVFNFDTTMSALMKAGFVQVNVTCDFTTSSNDWGAVSTKGYDSLTTNQGEVKDGYSHYALQDNFNYNSSWLTVNKDYLNVTFYTKNPAAAFRSNFSNIKVSFRLNGIPAYYEVSNSDVTVQRNGFSDVHLNLPASQTETPVAATGTNNDFSLAYNTANGSSKRVLFDVRGIDYIRSNSGVTITNDGGTTNYTIEQAITAGWLSAGTVTPTTSSLGNARCDFTFAANGTYRITIIADGMTKHGVNNFRISVTVGGINTLTKPAAPTLTYSDASAIDETSWISGTAVSMTPASAATDTYVYYYKTVSDVFSSTNLTPASITAANAEFTGDKLFQPSQVGAWTRLTSLSNFTVGNLTTGYHGIMIYAVNVAGQISDGTFYSYKVDNTTPDVSVSLGDYDGSWTNATINGTLSAVSLSGVAGYEYSLDGNTWTAIASAFTVGDGGTIDIDDSDETNGERFYFRATSTAGLTSTGITNAVAVKYDKVLPTANAIAPVEFATYSTANSPKVWLTSADWTLRAVFTFADGVLDKSGFVLSYTVSDGVTTSAERTITLTKAAAQTLTVNLREGTSAGAKTISWSLTDQAGNKFASSASADVLVDGNRYKITTVGSTNYGTISGINPDGYARGETVNLTLAAEDGYRLYKFEKDGVEVPTAITAASYTVSDFNNFDTVDNLSDVALVLSVRQIVTLSLADSDGTADYTGVTQAIGLVTDAGLTVDADGKVMLSGVQQSVALAFTYKDGDADITAADVLYAKAYTVNVNCTAFNAGSDKYVSLTDEFTFTYTITKVNLIVTIDGKAKYFGTANPALTFSQAGLVGADTVSNGLTTTAVTASNVGEYPISLDGALVVENGADTERVANYNVTVNNGKLTVNKLPVAVAFGGTGITKAYDARVTNDGTVALDVQAAENAVENLTVTLTETAAAQDYKFSYSFTVTWSKKHVGGFITRVSINNASIKVFAEDGITEINKNNFDIPVTALTSSAFNDATITKKLINVTHISVNDKTYDGTKKGTINGFTATGIIDGDVVLVIIKADADIFSSENVAYDGEGNVIAQTINIDDGNIVLGGSTDKGNYDVAPLALGEISATINPLPVRYSVGAISKVYDGTTTCDVGGISFSIITELPLIGGTVPDLSVTAATAAYGSANADSFATVQLTGVALAGADSFYEGTKSNYELIGGGNATVSAAITKARINASINLKSDVTLEYGDAMPEASSYNVTYSLAGYDDTINPSTELVFKKEGLADVTVSGFIAVVPYSVPNSRSDAGEYGINYFNGLSDNFEFFVTTGKVNVGKATISFSVADHTRAFGVANPTFTVVYDGFKNNESITSAKNFVAPVLSCAATTDSPMSSEGYAITVDSVGSAANYNLVYNAEDIGVLFVTKTAVSGFAFEGSPSLMDGVYIKEVDYSGANQVMAVNTRAGYKVDAKYYTNPAKTGASTTSVKDVGVYYVTVTVSKLKGSGAIDDNYEPMVINGRLTVRAVAPTIIVSGKTVSYTGNVVEINRAVVSENLSVEYLYKSGDRNLSSAPKDAGTYTVVVSFAGNKNYTAKSVVVSLTITKVSVYVTPIKTKFIEDGTAHTLIYTSDAPEGVLGQPVFAADADTSVAGTYEYTISALNNNYVVVGGNGSIVVGKSTVAGDSGTASAIGDTVLTPTTSFEFKSIASSEDATSPEAILWTKANSGVSGSDKVKGIIEVKMFTGEADAKVEAQPNGLIKLSISEQGELKFRDTDKVMLIKADGTVVDVNATFNEGKLEFVTDEVGDFVIVQDGAARLNTIYTLVVIGGMAIVGLIMLIVVKKLSLLRLLKAATRRARTM